MIFVIVGYGRVGARTARILSEEGHDVTVVDDDDDRIDRATRTGFDATSGDGADEATLLEAGIDEADAIGAFTPDLNVNFAACMVGTHYDCRTVLRIDEDYREDIYEKYAQDVDEIIYPERLGAAGAKTALLGGDFNVVADLATNLQLTVLEIDTESPAVGKRMSELDLPNGARIYAHGRARESLTIPLPGTELEAGDEVAVITETESTDEVHSLLTTARP
ncbi:TrkA family potassium uptake protein [Salinadaptatus halalkaliphilus]|uniref:TrkA family potassium uptake protein n=1 Tax=Salinadaptatus halalkaliphilus TaxID=2419781 RepID=A0A4S3TIP0_9EURY|nr:TrkA family potassium uptake protein [Salinadaptatus halalkaliphilus]THE63826.1 TrkA family potassium uptake protein [Salinadaptatus halalkaliphilus]